MTTIATLRDDFLHEVQTTRKHLERLPADRLEWRPHDKSFTALELACHIVECVGWAGTIFTSAEFDFDPKSYVPFRAAAVSTLLDGFDAAVERGRGALAAASDATASEPWRLRIMGRVRFEKTKAAVFRDFTLHHLIHHRGQFSVYLRLMDVPVPGSYGPTADERG